MWENGARTREEERERIQEVRQTGLNHPLYMLLDRVDPYPVHFLLILAVRSDPDGSGSNQRSWSVSLIRTHQVHGSEPLTVGLGLFFLFSWVSCANCTNYFAIWTFVCFNFLYKKLKKLLYVLEAFLYCFMMLLHAKIDKKYICIYFTCSCIFAYSFDEFLA